MRKLVLAAALAFIFYNTLLALFLRTDYAGTHLCNYARSALAQATDLRVEVGVCRMNPVTVSLDILDMQAGRAGEKPVFEAKRVSVGVRLRRLLAGKLHIDKFEVDHPVLDLTLSAPEGERKPWPASCRLDLGPLEISGALVMAGTVDVAAPGWEVHLRKLGVEAEDRDGRLEVVVKTKGGRAAFAGRKIKLRRGRIEAGLDRSTGVVHVDRLDLVTRPASLFARGRIDDACAPLAELEGVLNTDLAEAARLEPRIGALKGRAAVTATAEITRGFAFRAHGDLNVVEGAVRSTGIGDVHGDFVLTPSEVTFDKLTWPMGRGQTVAKGEIRFTSGLPMKAEATLRDVELGRLVARLAYKPGLKVNLRGGGRARIAGTLAPFHLVGDTALDISDFVVLKGPWEKKDSPAVVSVGKARLTSELELGLDRLELRNGLLSLGESQLATSGTLYYDRKLGMDLVVDSDTLQLSETTIAKAPMSGHGSLHAKVTGPYSDPTVDARVDLREVVVRGVALGVVQGPAHYHDRMVEVPAMQGQKGRSQYSASVTIDARGERTQLIGGRAELTDARLSDLVELVAGVSPKMARLRGKLEGWVTGEARTEGIAAEPDAQLDAKIKELVAWGQRFDSAVVKVAMVAADSLRAERLELMRDEGRISVQGFMIFGGEVAAQLHVLDLPLGSIDSIREAGWDVSGDLRASASAAGTFADPKVEGDLIFSGLGAEGYSIGDSRLDVALDGDNLRVTGTLGKNPIEATATLVDDLPFKMKVRLRESDLMARLPPGKAPEGLKSGLRGTLTVEGSLRRPKEASAVLDLTSFFVEHRGLRFENESPVEMTYSKGEVGLKQLALKGPFGRLRASGTRSKDGRLDLAVNAFIDLAALQRYAPDMESVSGQMDLEMTLTGTAAAPNLIGSATLRDGALRLRNLPVAVRDVSGTLSFSQSSVVVDYLEARLNGGRASVRGEVGLEKMRPRRMDLTAKVENVPVRVEDVPLTVQGELNLYGPMNDLVLGGEVEIPRLRFERDIDIERTLLDFQRRPPQPKVLEKAGEVVKLDVTVRLGRAVRVENNLAKADIRGEFKVTGTNKRVGLLGTITAENGTAAFRGKDFALQSAVVNFADPTAIKPSFDISAESQVRDYKVALHAYGTPREPKLELKSEPDLSEADIGLLLALGFTSRDFDSVGQNVLGSGLTLGLEAAYQATGLSEQVKRFIPQNEIFRDTALRFTSAYSEASGQLEPVLQLESKFLTDNMQLRGQAPMIPNARGKRLQAEYRLSDRVSAQAQFTDQSTVGDFGDLGLDLKLRWELE